jgi:ketosteroid isomerase-like protein
VAVTTRAEDILAAAEQRAVALRAGDAEALRRLLHPDMVWTSHTGDVFDRDEYLRSNVDGPTRWRRQRLRDPRIVVVGATAVLHCLAEDSVETGAEIGRFEMPMTQTWVHDGEAGWRLLAGHAGPLR